MKRLMTERTKVSEPKLHMRVRHSLRLFKLQSAPGLERQRKHRDRWFP